MPRNFKYDEQHSMAEFYIASRDEIEIEAAYFGCSKLYREDLRQALIVIDRLKMAGKYDEYREQKLRSMKLREQAKALADAYPNMPDTDDLTNFLRGLNSANPKVRAEFGELYVREGFATKFYPEVRHLLRMLPRVTVGKRGPKPLRPPWRDANDAMDNMRLFLADGLNLSDAALEAARRERQVGQKSCKAP